MVPGRFALMTLGTNGVAELIKDIAMDQFDNLTYVQAIDDLLTVVDEEDREILMEKRNETLNYITILEQQLVVVRDYGGGTLTMDDLLGK